MIEITSIDGWITFEDYCLKYGEKKGTVQKRAADGNWERGVHYSSPDGSQVYVHEARAAAWLRERGRLPAGLK